MWGEFLYARPADRFRSGKPNPAYACCEYHLAIRQVDPTIEFAQLRRPVCEVNALLHSRAAVVGFNVILPTMVTICSPANQRISGCPLSSYPMSHTLFLDEGAPCGLAQSVSRWYPCEDTPHRLIDDSPPI